MVHRSMANQRSDYQFLYEQIKRLDTKKTKHFGKTKNDVAQIAKLIIKLRGATSYFALHKIFYLIECKSHQVIGHSVTDAFFIRQKDGPYCTDLHISKLKKSIDNLIVQDDNNKLVLVIKQDQLFTDNNESTIAEELNHLIKNIVSDTRNLSDAELKTKVYMTAPMRRLLKMEKMQLLNMYNAPISFDI
jgi:hypothetical protein